MIFTYLKQPLRAYTFEAPKIKQWVETHCQGKTVLNLFAGPTRLIGCEEITNDLDPKIQTGYHMDALDAVKMFAKNGCKFDVVLLDPPYSYRKGMEKYNGNQNSRFKKVLDHLPDILVESGVVITFGYHSRVMSGCRGFRTKEICLISHAGAQRDTFVAVEGKLNGDSIAIVEERVNKVLACDNLEEKKKATL